MENNVRAVSTTTGRYCTAFVYSDQDRGGWMVVCERHGRIVSSISDLGRADAFATDHVTKMDRLDK